MLQEFVAPRADLHQRILNAFKTITPEILTNVHESVLKRVRRCVQVQGAHFEQLL